MREIKFRVWNGVNMQSADRVRAMGGLALMEGLTSKDLLVVPTPKYEVMQYTEYDDKNKVEIYDGDLLKVNKVVLEVIYLNGSPALQYVDSKDFYEYLCNVDGIHHTEVVGNIYFS